jgi:hydrogenase maturation protein HypF
MAARFHRGLADAVVAMARRLTGFDTVALSGGCFQNAVLFELIEQDLREAGFRVLLHRAVPTNDGGLSLGQVVVAAAQLIASDSSSSHSLPPALGSRLRGNDDGKVEVPADH